MSKPNNLVYVGKKPLYVYTEAARRHYFEEGEVVIAARGNLISRAILVAIRVSGNAGINTIIGYERIAGEDGKPRDVPNIQIVVSRLPKAQLPPSNEVAVMQPFVQIV